VEAEGAAMGRHKVIANRRWNLNFEFPRLIQWLCRIHETKSYSGVVEEIIALSIGPPKSVESYAQRRPWVLIGRLY
jgi:hypothetical protein